MPRAVAVWTLGALLGGAVLLLIEPADLFGRAPPANGEVSATPTQTAVVDGETLRLQEVVVRLLGVAAPPRGQICHHADGTSFDCGAASAESLSHMVSGHGVTCQLHGRDSAGRTLAVCQADGRALNQAQVIGGWARASAEMPSLGGDETEARTQHRGLWAGLFDPQS
jgi:endonuclease YncB( thermonuclease family)